MFEKGKYDKAYAKAHIKTKHLPFNDQNPDDMVLLEWLSSKGNVVQYIKQLIREDMEKVRIRSQNGSQIENEQV